MRVREGKGEGLGFLFFLILSLELPSIKNQTCCLVRIPIYLGHGISSNSWEVKKKWLGKLENISSITEQVQLNVTDYWMDNVLRAEGSLKVLSLVFSSSKKVKKLFTLEEPMKNNWGFWKCLLKSILGWTLGRMFLALVGSGTSAPYIGGQREECPLH